MKDYLELDLQEMENWADNTWVQGASATVRVYLDGEWTKGRLTLEASARGEYRVVFGLSRIVYKGESMTLAVDAYNEFQFAPKEMKISPRLSTHNNL
jgi:hypothetical protein